MSTEPDRPSSPSPLFNIAQSLGRVEGMVGAAMTTLTDHNKRLENHDGRISDLEKKEAGRKGYIAGIAFAVSVVVAAINFAIQHWNLLQ